MSRAIFTIMLIFPLFAWSSVETKKIKRDLYQTPPELLKMNEVVELKPIADHQINLEAPNACGKRGQLVKVKKSQLSCQATAPGKDRYEVFICDKGKTFCKQQAVNIETESPSGFWAWMQYYWGRYSKKDTWTAPSKVTHSPNSVTKGFIHNDAKAAFAKAKSSNKPLLLFYTQKYCPPCRLVKETSLISDDFQTWAKGVVLLQLDSDVDKSGDLIDRLQLKYTPTFVLFNSHGVELDRLITYVSPYYFQAWLAKVKDLEPVGELQRRHLAGEGLTVGQKSRLLYWYIKGYRDSEAKEFYKKHKRDFITKDPLAAKLLQDTKKEDVKDLLDFSEELLAATESCSSLKIKKGTGLLGDISGKAKKMSLPELARLDSLFVKYARYFADSVVKNPSDLACYVNQFYTEMSQYRFYRSTKDKRTKNLSMKLTQMLENFPKLPGAEPKSSIDIYKGYVVERKKQTEIMNNLSKNNEKDFSFDYLSAMYDFYDKDNPNYERSLQSVNKALEKAEGRIWEKATKFKIGLLIKMKRYAEARDLISDTLKKVSLPKDKSMMIHKFVQSLRDFERDLAKKEVEA